HYAAGSAAPAEGPASAMDQARPHAVSAAYLHEPRGRLVQRPDRRDVAAVLVAVGIPKHHLLLVAAHAEPAPVERLRERLAHDVGAALEVADRLEERDHVHRQ